MTTTKPTDPFTRILRHAAMIAALAGMTGCTEKNEKKSATSRTEAPPAMRSTSPAAGPAEGHPAIPPVGTPLGAQSRPAATRPVASHPPSTYDSNPPYRVDLFVANPEEDQPGWLKIMALDNTNAVAAATGIVPEQNHIEVTTQNVQRIRVHISLLPLAEGKRIVLRIDKQGIEIARKNRKYVVLEHRPTGAWEVVNPEK